MDTKHTSNTSNTNNTSNTSKDMKSYVYESIQKVIKTTPELSSVFNKSINFENETFFNKSKYTSIITAVIGQLIRFKHARSLRKKLYVLFGSDFKVKDINCLSDKQLVSMGFNQTCITTIRNVNKYIGKNKDYSIKDIYLNVKGIGEWTFKTAKLTHDPLCDTFPHTDVFIRNKLSKLLNKKLSFKDVEELSKQWKGYRGIVTWYIWRDF
jgi:3-methyladenine DNA glycosylase/8-oxoguanine DNA glycosylase